MSLGRAPLRSALASSVMMTALAMIACSTTVATGPSEATTKLTCLWSTAKCWPNICDGCTAGGEGKCPPKDEAFSEVCSPVASEDECRRKAGSPRQVSTNSSQMSYVGNVRLLRGATCAEYREGGLDAAESTETICAGTCP